MHLHFACSPSRIHINVLKECEVKNLLFSYAFIKKPQSLIDMIGDYVPDRIILDSGAFSVWSNGGTVDREQYADFCSRFQELVHPDTKLFIVNLDVLPGQWGHVPSPQEIAESAEKGWENMLYLESRGLKVIHVFHQHEDFAILDRLRNHSDYIGISPANDVSQQEKTQWLKKVFFHMKDNLPKTHGFAVTATDQVFGYPFYSVDSSSWVSPARFGRIAVLDERYQVKTFPYKSQEDVEHYWKYVSKLGIERLSSPTWHHRVKIAIEAYKELGNQATKLWDSRGITFNE